MALGKTKPVHDTLRVLYVNLESSVGGAEQSLLLLARFVPERVQLYAACPAGDLADRLNELGVITYEILSAPKRFNHLLIWLFYLTFVNLQLAVIVFKARPQVIHANNLKAVLAVVLANTIMRKKLIWHARDLKCSGLAARLCGCLSSKIIAISQTVKDRLVEQKVKVELIEVIYNGVVISELAAGIDGKKHPRPITFANIGQFIPWKNQFLFIEAAERFLQDNPDARFFLVGDDLFGRDSNYKNKLVDRVQNSRFASKITLIGWQENLASFWPTLDCLIHTAEIEPFGRIIIEAMAHCVPVIAAASSGPAEIITHGKTGLLFNLHDIEDLLKAMKTISEDREMAQNLARNARQHVIFNFHAKQTAEKITTVYEKLIAA
jgi:glycosyltransferase involved in cell wall biosynthesis